MPADGEAEQAWWRRIGGRPGAANPRDARAPRHEAEPRGDGALRDRRAEGVRRLGRHDSRDRETDWPQPRAGRGALEHRLVRGANAGAVRRRAGVTNWAICDALCFHLFDRTPHAWRKIEQWSGRRGEFVKRAAFALLASVALHDRTTPNAPFLRALPLIERAAIDDRNFVKKGVSWALRGVGRRNPQLNAAAIALARRLAAASEPSARWIGKDALRELTRAPVGSKGIAAS